MKTFFYVLVSVVLATVAVALIIGATVGGIWLLASITPATPPSWWPYAICFAIAAAILCWIVSFARDIYATLRGRYAR